MHTVVLSFFVLFSQMAWSSQVTLEELAGMYEVQVIGSPVINRIDIQADGKIVLIENSPMGELRCEGLSQIVNSTLESKVSCDNGLNFEQRINLSNVDIKQDEFIAPVYSSLYGREVDALFKRLKWLRDSISP